MKSLFLSILFIFLLGTSESYGQANEFYFNGLADVFLKYPERGSGGRAIVHDVYNTLTLNCGGDFSGGTKLGPSFHVATNGALSIPDGATLRASVYSTTDYSTMTFNSRAWQTVQGTNGKAFTFQTHDNLGNFGFEAMAIYYGESGKIVMAHNGGNVGIGTSMPTEKLSVKGKIRAQEIKVENANWPDFVFAKSYILPTLKETETHIKETGHLPGIPSAEEVRANGVDLGEMNAKLLQKIEELTLHLIEMKKEMEELKDKRRESKL